MIANFNNSKWIHSNEILIFGLSKIYQDHLYLTADNWLLIIDRDLAWQRWTGKDIVGVGSINGMLYVADHSSPCRPPVVPPVDQSHNKSIILCAVGASIGLMVCLILIFCCWDRIHLRACKSCGHRHRDKVCLHRFRDPCWKCHHRHVMEKECGDRYRAIERYESITRKVPVTEQYEEDVVIPAGYQPVTKTRRVPVQKSRQVWESEYGYALATGVNAGHWKYVYY